MKYVLAALAVVAAIAALIFRPPHADLAAPAPIDPRARPPAEAAALDAGAALPSARPGRGLGRSGRGRDGDRARLVVYVAGEVEQPGVYTFAPGTRAKEALERAGGPKSDADLVAVNLAAPLEDGTEIAFPKIGETLPRARRAQSASGRRAHAGRAHGRGHRQRRTDDEPSQSVDLNAADESELESIPGIGPALAARIIAYRQTNGPFASVDELADISGITPGLQAKMASFVVVR